MKQTIKFRGKRLTDGQWVYGDLLHIAGGCVIYHGSQTESQLIEDRQNVAIELYMDEVSPVDPDTVGQFTGLHDANGKEIYEGDIITWLTGRGGMGFMEMGRVEWRSDEGCYVVINRFLTRDNREIVQPLIRCTRDVKVRGNIHDNPELLKGGNDGQTTE